MADLTKALEAVKTLEMGLQAFNNEFGSIISFQRSASGYEAHYGPEYPKLHVPPIEVTSHEVRIGLGRFLSGDTSAQELEAWANFLILCECYEFQGDLSDQNVLSSVLHLMATPNLHGELTREKVSFYLACLEEKREP